MAYHLLDNLISKRLRCCDVYISVTIKPKNKNFSLSYEHTHIPIIRFVHKLHVSYTSYDVKVVCTIQLK